MKKITPTLFIVILFELMLGGGGRLTSYGSVSLRMILFGIAILVTCIHVLRGEKISKEYWLITILFAIVLAIGFLRGIAAGASRTFWWEDVKPLSYFFMLPFFGFTIQNISIVDATARSIRQAGIILSVLFISALVLIHVEIIPFSVFYKTVIGTGEFFFRGELTFFYKGFIYLCIAFLFVHFSNVQHKHLVMALLAMAILLSVTRGFLFALTLTYAFYYFPNKAYFKSVPFIVLALVIVVFGQTAISRSSQVIARLTDAGRSAMYQRTDSNLLGDKSYADRGRLQQIKEVVSQTTLSTSLLGHGFGMGIPSRPIHMEISYLEIFHKQGVIGLAFWAYLLWLLYQKYKNAQGNLRDPFFFGSLFVYFQSLTNQYINNPIGLSLVLLSIVCLDQLKKE